MDSAPINMTMPVNNWGLIVINYILKNEILQKDRRDLNSAA